MTRPDALLLVPAANREALREQLARARHDLGKYVAFQVRWLAPEAGIEDLREALLADLGRTRSGGGLVESAPALWDRLRPPLVAEAPLGDGSRVDLRGDPDLAAVDGAIARIRALLPGIPGAERDDLERARRAAGEVAAGLQRLLQRARASDAGAEGERS